jgi:hypothetical protein
MKLNLNVSRSLSAALFLLLGSFAAQPCAHASGVIEFSLANVRNQIRTCSVLPVTYRDNHVKVYHALVSSCPTVKVFEKGKARIKFEQFEFTAVMAESQDSDGDFYDILITESNTHDSFRLNNVRAYGDVLLGLLGGDLHGVKETYVPVQYQKFLND